MSLEDRIINWLRNYFLNNNLNSFVVGVSGGIDSALVSTLCSMTKLKTIVVTIPINSNLTQHNNSIKHINNLKNQYSNVTHLNIDLTNSFNCLKNDLGEYNNLSLANSKSRLRMLCLYNIASVNNGIVVGTGNKVEDFGVGFFTKYGDGGVDISPIADLYKSEVYNMSKRLNVIQEIIESKPTDGLWDDNRTDEDQLTATYDELEWAMEFIEKKLDVSTLTERQQQVLSIYNNFNSKNKHKMENIPIFKK